MKICLASLSLAVLTASVCAEEPKPATPPVKIGIVAKPILSAKNVSVDEAAKLIAETKDLIVLDVRTPEEYDAGHIKGAVNLSSIDLEFIKSVAALNQSKQVLIHCASGRRSHNALEALAGKVTFPKVYHLAEGFTAWKKAGQPVEGNPLPSKTKKPAGK